MTDSPAPAKKRSLGKLILKLAGILVLLVVVGLVTIFLMRNYLIRRGVMRAGEYATQQTTGLEAADLSIGSHSLTLTQLDIANLKDYKEPKLLTMKECFVDVDTGSLLTSEATINMIQISGLELTLETNQNLKNNLSELIETLKKQSPATNAPPDQAGNGATGSAPAESPGKKLKITELKLAGTKVHLRGIVTMDIDLGPVDLKDPTNPDGRPMKIADLMTKILIHISQQIVENPQIPGNIKDSMKNVQALVNGLDKDLRKDLTKFKDAEKSLQGLGKNPDAGKQLQDAGKNLQNLLGGNKSTQPGK